MKIYLHVCFILITLITTPSFSLSESPPPAAGIAGKIYSDITGLGFVAKAQQGGDQFAIMGGYGIEFALAYRLPLWLGYGLMFSYQGLEHYSKNSDKIGNYQGVQITTAQPFIAYFTDTLQIRLSAALNSKYEFSTKAVTGGTIGLASPSSVRISIGHKAQENLFEYGGFIQSTTYQKWVHSDDEDIDLNSKYSFNTLGFYVRWPIDWQTYLNFSQGGQN